MIVKRFLAFSLVVLISLGGATVESGVAGAAGGAVTEVTAPEGGYFYAASCWSAANCAAVGQDFHSQGANSNGTPISAAEAGGTWATAATEAAASNGGVFYGVKCWSATNCIAVGNDWNLNDEPIFASSGPNGWNTPVELPTSSGGYLYALSCWNSTHCMAVGADVGGEPIYAALTMSGGTWSSGGVTEVTTPQAGEFLGVSCWETGGAPGCTAVGDGDNHQPIRDTATDAGGTWSWPTPTVVAGADSVGKFTGISCVDPKDCTAVGDDTSSSNEAIWTAEVGGVWPSTITKVATTNPTIYNAVDCTEAEDCIVVGQEQTAQAFSAIYASETGGTWGGPVVVAAPGGSGVLRGVDCPSAASCAAVGNDANGEAFVATIARAVSRPGAPRSVLATPGNLQAVVKWSPPLTDGGSPITLYTVSTVDKTTHVIGGQTCTYRVGDPNPNTCTVLHLVGGDSYTFSVTATNAVGNGPPSVPSPAVTLVVPPPSGSPSTPTNLTATVTAGSSFAQGVVLTWARPGLQPSTYDLKYEGYSVSSSGRTTSKLENVVLPGTATTWTARIALGGETDTFSLTAANARGTSTPATVTVVLDAFPPSPLVSVVNHDADLLLSWTYDDNADESIGISKILGAAIYEGTSPGGESTTPLVLGLSVSAGAIKNELVATALIRGLTVGTTYYFRVALLNKAGPSKLSTEVSGTPGAPGVPTLRVPTPGNRSVTLTWTAPTSPGSSPITGYDVFKGSTLAELLSASPLNASPITQTSTTVTGLTAGKLYFFEVAAINASGVSQRSNHYSAVPLVGPSAPELSFTPGNREIALAWKAPSSEGGTAITGYDVYESAIAGGEGAVPFAETPPSATSYLVTNDTISIQNGTTYYFVVAAVNAGGPGTASNEVAATPVPVPNPPQGLTATAGAESVSLTWSAPSSTGGSQITGFDVFEGTSAQGEGTSPVASGITKTSTTITGLVAGTTYYFLVEAVNASGSSFPSSEASATPTPKPAPPSAPLGLIARAGNREIRLSWSPPASPGSSSVTGYEVFEGTSAGSESATPIAQSAVTSFLVTNDLTSIKNGTRYFFTVEAVNSFTSGDSSNEASATPEPVPGSPVGLTATPGVNSVSLSWTVPTDQGGSAITGYDLYEGSSSGGESATPVNAVLITRTSVTVVVQPPDSLHYFIVAAVNASGPGFPSDEATATPEGLPGIPTNLSAVPGESQATLSWAKPLAGTCTQQSPDYASCEVSGYVALWRLHGSRAAPKSQVVSGAASTSSAIQGLSDSVAYDVAVEATNASGNGGQTAWVEVTPTIHSPPGLVLNLTGIATAGSPAAPLNQGVQLEWSAPFHGGCTSGIPKGEYDACKISGYILKYDAYSVGNGGRVTIKHNVVTIPAAAVLWTALTALTGVSDTITLAAQNSYGTGPAATITELLDALPPTPSVSAVSGDGIAILTWTYDDAEDESLGISQISGAAIFEGTSPGGEATTPVQTPTFVTGITIGGTITAAETVRGLANGTTYFFTVAQRNNAGLSKASKEISVTPGTPGAPIITSTTPGNGAVTLAWNAPTFVGSSAITGYDVFTGVTLAAAEAAGPANAGLIASTSTTVTGLTAGKTYYFEVAAVNAFGVGPRSPATHAIPLAGSSSSGSKANRGTRRLALARVATARSWGPRGWARGRSHPTSRFSFSGRAAGI